MIIFFLVLRINWYAIHKNICGGHCVQYYLNFSQTLISSRVLMLLTVNQVKRPLVAVLCDVHVINCNVKVQVLSSIIYDITQDTNYRPFHLIYRHSVLFDSFFCRRTIFQGCCFSPSQNKITGLKYHLQPIQYNYF